MTKEPWLVPGRKVGHWTAIGPDTGNKSQWLLQCACGNVRSRRIYDIENGSTKSCGCYGKKIQQQLNDAMYTKPCR